MFKKLIVGVDGREGGADALALARVLGADDAEVTLVGIYPQEPIAWRGASAAYEEALKEETDRVLTEARKDLGAGAAIRTHAAPDVGRGLHEVAATVGADVIVVGSSRKGHVGRVFTGDDTRHALNGATCAVAVAPAGYSHSEVALRKIGVGYDGSAESEHALAFARDLAREKGAGVAAMEVLYFPARYFVGPSQPDRSTVLRLLDESRHRISQIDGVEGHAAAGVPAEELARFSESVDLMIVGSRGYGPVGRLVYGSVGQDLARTARSPLLVLPRLVREPEPSAAESGVANAAV